MNMILISGYEGVERRPELAAIMVLFLQDCVVGPGRNEVAAGEQDPPKFRSRTSTTIVVPGATSNSGWRMCAA